MLATRPMRMRPADQSKFSCLRIDSVAAPLFLIMAFCRSKEVAIKAGFPIRKTGERQSERMVQSRVEGLTRRFSNHPERQHLRRFEKDGIVQQVQGLKR